MSAEDKYKEACIEYCNSSKLIKTLNAKIGRHLALCPDASEGKDSHLKAAYKMERGNDEIYGLGHSEPYFVNHDGSVIDYLAPRCNHCLSAHLTIHLRFEARRRFANAKRRVIMLGVNAQ